MTEDRTQNPSLSTPGERYGERLRTNSSAEQVQSRVMQAETRSLAMTFNDLTASGALPQAAAVILGARRRYITGEGKSAMYAGLLSADLSATLSNVFLIDGHALTPLTVLTDVRDKDLLIAFSLRRYRRETTKLGELFRAAGGKLVLVTDSDEAPLAPLADATIRVRTDSASYAASPTAMAAVCHLLSTLTTASAKGARRRLTIRDELATALDLYQPLAPDSRTPGPHTPDGDTTHPGVAEDGAHP